MIDYHTTYSMHRLKFIMIKTKMRTFFYGSVKFQNWRLSISEFRYFISLSTLTH